jgi:hypothetical protein
MAPISTQGVVEAIIITMFDFSAWISRREPSGEKRPTACLHLMLVLCCGFIEQDVDILRLLIEEGPTLHPIPFSDR